jgi:GxxExxY protein
VIVLSWISWFSKQSKSLSGQNFLTDLLHKELSYKIVGAAMEVHRVLGPGFLEAVYQKALVSELSLQGIRFEEFKQLPVYYKEKLVGNYEADIVVEDQIILELKSISALNDRHKAQAIHYLTATGLRLAILLKFGAPSLQHKRVVK